MKKSYSYFFKQFKQPLSGRIFKFCFAPLILIIFQLQSAAQDNFTTISWGTAASQPYSVSEAQGKVVNGKLYSFGGFDSRKSTFTPTKRSYVYDPVANKWSAIADLPYTPNGTNYGGVTHAGIATDGTNIYIAGGYTSSTSGTGQIFGTKQVWKYIISQNSYTRLPDLPISVAAGQLECLSGKLHYIGGTNSSRTLDLGNHYVLDLNNLSGGWKTLASLPNPRHHAGSAVYGGKIYFIGGQHHHDDNLVTQKDVHAYNPSNNTWTKVADLPVPTGANGRGHISSAVAVMGDRILVLGGEINHKTSINMVSAYSPATNSWKNLTPLPQSRFSGVAGAMNGNIYYTGGSRTSTTYKGIPATASQSTTVSPLADAFVRNGSYAATNYGRNTSLVVKGSTASGYTRTSYLKFSLSNVSSVSSAKLRIYGHNIENTTTISVSAYGVNSDSWTETGITFNNAPAASTAALSSAGVNNTAKYYEIDVTSFVKTQFAGDKIVSFLIKDPSNKNINLEFNSKENANNRPQLVVVSSQGTSATTPIVSRSRENIFNSEENLENSVVYPNPMQKQLNIKLPATYKGDFSFTIADQTGRIYNLGKIRIQPGGSIMNFDISKFSLHPGVYFLRITSETKSEAIKLIVQ